MRSFLRDVLGLSSLLVVAHATMTAHAQCDEGWFGGQPLTGTDGDVITSCEWDPDGTGPKPSQLIVGGFFKFAGDRFVSSIASFDGTAWHPLGEGLSSAVVRDGLALVSAAIPFRNNLVVSGWFDRSGSTPLNSVAMWDGAQWTRMGEGFDARAKTFTIHNGELYAGGGFLRSGDQEVICVARWDGASWRDLDRGLDGLVTGLVSFQGRLIACGDFGATANGLPVLRLAAWNGSRWSPVTEDLRNANSGIVTVNAITVFNDELVISGLFDSVGGVNAHGVAAYNGATWRPLGEGFATDTYALTFAPYRGELIAGGNLLNGVTLEGFRGVAAWNGTRWRDIGLESASPFTLTPFRGELFGGSILPLDSWRLAKWNGITWSGVGPGPSGIIQAVESFNGELVAGGDFLQIGSVSNANGVGLWRDGSWIPLGQGFNNTVIDLDTSTGWLYAAGAFTRAGPNLVNGVARWDGTQWRPLGVGLAGSVYDLVLHQGSLHAAGAFGFSGRTALNGVARWDGVRWQPLGSGAGGASREVFTLESIGIDLYAGGAFSSMGGTPANGISAWNGTAWRALSSGVQGDFPYVYDIDTLDGRPVIAGTFQSASSTPGTTGIARWTGSRWATLGGGLPGITNFFAISLHTHRGDLYVGGLFDVPTSEGVLNQVARWDGERWRPLDTGLRFGFNETPLVWDMTSIGGNLAVAGIFSEAGDKPAAHLAFWGCPCRADLNNDGFVDAFDYLAFVDAYEEPAALADFNADGFVDFFDYIDFVLAFEAGC
jgi:trimeric autotransporter adhesin